MTSRLTFYGGAGTVTGANFLLDTGTKRILIDCGIVQQEHACDIQNLEAFPFSPESIDALIVTHAHADHIGRIPKLVRDGFKGSIFSTSATKELAAAMFDDALRIMQEHERRERCPIMYEKEDIAAALSLWIAHEYHKPFAVGDIRIEFKDAGHILGSALVFLSRDGNTIVFSGDVGNSPEPLLRDTESISGAHYLVVESVYGDRVHEAREDRLELLRAAAEAVQKSKGTLLIPSFSIERTQVLLFELGRMIEDRVIEPLPVFLDSPLAARVTQIFRSHKNVFNAAIQDRLKAGDDPFSFPGLSVTVHTHDSREIHRTKDPKIIIAGSGMSEGGRVRLHEREYLPHKDAVLLFVGYQTPGSLGRRIQDGARHVDIDGERVRVRAQILSLTGYSGHADRDQLLSFVESAGDSLRKVFVTMGEMKSSIFFAQRVQDFLGVDTVVPQRLDSHDIDL